MSSATPPFVAGAASADITPSSSVFLSGYPNVSRWSTGVHDPLLAAALYLNDGHTPLLWIGSDLIYVPVDLTRRAVQAISAATGVPEAHILISATHTHSGPLVVQRLASSEGSTDPKPDPAYLQLLEERLIQVGVAAFRNARPAEISIGQADATGIGTHRHDPAGPCDLAVPLVLAREKESGTPLALMAVCNMHPTVMHEDSLLISGDFPNLARQYLQEEVFQSPVPIVYHMGTAGNQSPRHVTRSNTFDEARRLGRILGQAIEQALPEMTRLESASFSAEKMAVELPVRPLPPLEEAITTEKLAAKRLAQLREGGAPRTDVRTAECDWFGAQHLLRFARHSDQLAGALAERRPIEIQLLSIGAMQFIGWPGEVFIEFGLQVRRQYPQAVIITLAGGSLFGYVVTQQAVEEKRYEALNAIYASPESGKRMVEATSQLLARHQG